MDKVAPETKDGKIRQNLIITTITDRKSEGERFPKKKTSYTARSTKVLFACKCQLLKNQFTFLINTLMIRIYAHNFNINIIKSKY